MSITNPLPPPLHPFKITISSKHQTINIVESCSSHFTTFTTPPQPHHPEHFFLIKLFIFWTLIYAYLCFSVKQGRVGSEIRLRNFEVIDHNNISSGPQIPNRLALKSQYPAAIGGNSQTPHR